MTDNRTNEPTEAQVEAAADAYDLHYKESSDVDMAGQGERCCAECGYAFWWPKNREGPVARRRAHAMRAALVAAQGAAPQAGSTTKVVPVSYEASASCSHGVCPKGCSHLMWQCSTCSCEGGWGMSRDRLTEIAAEHVCPVLPSSGVDEGKIESLILGRTATAGARAVAEWFRSNTSKSA